MCLQNAAIVGMLDELDRRISSAVGGRQRTEPDAVKELEADLFFAKRLGEQGRLKAQQARKAAMLTALFGTAGCYGVMKGSA
jgi:hypothetical protein